MSRLKNDPAYSRWKAIRSRCYYKRNKMYKYYGGKGIGMCEEWRNSSRAFLVWAHNNGFREDLEIDRIDNSKDYSPDNCRWVTRKEQMNNFSRNHISEIEGQKYTISQLHDKTGISYSALKRRLRIGKNLEDLLKPSAEVERLGYKGTSLYNKWNSMLKRGRCKEWSKFSMFLEWSKNVGYKEGMSLWRIDCTKPFSPTNSYFSYKKDYQRK